MQSISSFSYSTLPHAAPLKRKTKYRDDSDLPVDPALTNLMHDPRVVRGNTFSAKTLSLSHLAETPIAKKVSRADAQRRKFTTRRSATPPAVTGRVHIDIQTDQYLEELSDRPVEVDAETQTQAFMDRPASPLFVPARTGHDVVTQILPGDLWDFDVEVEPILEVLVGKTLHVAMLEVMQEEELDEFWLRTEPSVAAANTRAQLLLLRQYADAEVADRAASAWHGLSRACHHHAYELAPEAQELRSWLNAVTQVKLRLNPDRGASP